jgi:hypothetical protein
MNEKHTIVDSIKLKVNAQMEDVTVKIENDIREIATMEVVIWQKILIHFNAS